MIPDSLVYVVFALVGTFISAVSQVLLKKAASRNYRSKIHEYLNPLVITAYAIFFIATLCSVFAYKGIPLLLGPVLESVSYIYVAIFGVKLFNERVNRRKIFALLLIIVGIITASL